MHVLPYHQQPRRTIPAVVKRNGNLYRFQYGPRSEVDDRIKWYRTVFSIELVPGQSLKFQFSD